MSGASILFIGTLRGPAILMLGPPFELAPTETLVLVLVLLAPTVLAVVVVVELEDLVPVLREATSPFSFSTPP